MLNRSDPVSNLNVPLIAPNSGSVSPSERWILITGVWAACVAFVCGITIADPDLWGHTLYGMRANELGVTAESVDPFSYTAQGESWVNHEWLSESQFGWLWSHYSSTGLVLWRNAWCLAVFAVTLIVFRRARVSLPAAVLLLVLNAETLSDFMVFVRPQMVTFGLFAIYLYLLRRFYDERNARLLIPLPFLMLLWVNHHGGFLAGIGVFGVTTGALALECFRSPAARRPTMTAAGVLLLTGLATLVTPYGPVLHEMLWHHLWTPQFVREWQPLWTVNFSPVYIVPFLITGIALCGSRNWKAVDLLLLAVVAWQAVSHVRHVALFCIATMILLPTPLSESIGRLFPSVIQQWSERSRTPLRLAAVTSIVLFLAVVHVRGSLRLWLKGHTPLDIVAETSSDVPGVPQGAISFLRTHGLSGNVLTDYGWGQYVIWHLHPQFHVAFDGRYRTVYSAEIERQFLAFQKLKAQDSDTTPLLDEYATDIVLLPNHRGPLGYMSAREDWSLVYRDHQASIFLRDQPDHARLITAFQKRPATTSAYETWTSFPANPVLSVPHAKAVAVTARHDRYQNHSHSLGAVIAAE